jgi:hypothetical protein
LFEKIDPLHITTRASSQLSLKQIMLHVSIQENLGHFLLPFRSLYSLLFIAFYLGLWVSDRLHIHPSPIYMQICYKMQNSDELVSCYLCKLCLRKEISKSKCSCNWCILPSVHEYEFIEDNVHSRAFFFLGAIHTSVLQRIHGHSWIWTCSHQCQMGKQAICFVCVLTKTFECICIQQTSVSMLKHIVLFDACVEAMVFKCFSIT